MRGAQSRKDSCKPIDARPRIEALSVMLHSHLAAARAIETSFPEIDRAAEAIAGTIESNGTLFYAAAGSSGLMALADACELPGTFGVPQEQVRIVMAGGVPADGRMPGVTEDQTDEARAAARTMSPGDIAIILSASGTTPFACAFAEEARQNGNTVIAIANSTPSRLLELADIAIAVPTGAEVVEGSTRLGAGTAQKIVLNMMSTQAGILLGHVHDGHMVNLVPDNIKLKKRAEGIVERIADVPVDRAKEALELAGFDTKLATLIALGTDIDEARAILSMTGRRLRESLSRLRSAKKQKN